MKKNYKYGRLYDFCIEDNYENPGRGVIKRKSRILMGLLSYLFIIISLFTYILDIYRNSVLLIIFILSCFILIFETRTGVISLINYYHIKSMRSKSKLNILELFCLYHNRDGNYIKLQEKQMIKIQHHPFDWSIIRIVFRDQYRNSYIFKVNLTNIHVKIHFANANIRRKIFTRDDKLLTTYIFTIDDLVDICDEKDFMIFLRNKYREISEIINNNM